MSENWEKAFNDYLNGKSYKEIAEKYGVSLSTVKSWKTRHWNSMQTKDKVRIPKGQKKKGPPYGSKNGTGPPKNQNARKHGLYAKWLPKEISEILGVMQEEDPKEILWQNIQLQYAQIIHSQKIMFVQDKNDKTIEKVEEKDGSVVGERWEVQQAWDKQAAFLNAQSRAMKTLQGMIKNYMELVNQDMMDEEQKARIELLHIQKKKLESSINDESNEDDGVVIINDI